MEATAVTPTITNGSSAAHGALSGIGRTELEEMVFQLRTQRDLAIKNEHEAIAVAARAEASREVMLATLSAVQGHCSLQLEELRVWRRCELEPLAKAIAIARMQHPKGCKFSALVEEVGEVARAMENESLERMRAELVDVAAVAIRMSVGECLDPMPPEEP